MVETEKKYYKNNKRKAEREPVPVEFTIQRMAHIARDYCTGCRGLLYDHYHAPYTRVAVRCLVNECVSPSLAKAVFASSRDGRESGFVVVTIVDYEFSRWWAPDGETARRFYERGVISVAQTESAT